LYDKEPISVVGDTAHAVKSSVTSGDSNE